MKTMAVNQSLRAVREPDMPAVTCESREERASLKRQVMRTRDTH